MSAIRPARRLLSRCLPSSTPTPRAIPSCCHHHAFHSSAPQSAPRRPRFSNVKAVDLGLTTPEKVDAYARERFPDYTEAELARLREKYTPAQLAALEAGEAALDPSELLLQGQLRRDLYRPDYVEDYSVVQPVIDWPLSKSELNLQPPQDFDDWLKSFVERMSRLYGEKAHDQVQRAYIRAIKKVKDSNAALVDLTYEELDDLEQNPEARKKYLVADDAASPRAEDAAADADAAPPATKTSAADAETHARMRDLYAEIEAKFATEMSELIASGRDEITRVELMRSELGQSPRFPMSPDIVRPPRDDGEAVGGPTRNPDDEVVDPAGQYEKLTQLTGLRAREAKGILAKILVRRTVHNQTRLGKIRSLSVVTVAGNGDGWLGVGVAKSTEANVAEMTSRLMAIKNMRPVRRYEHRTIFGNSTGKVSGTVVELRARPPGKSHIISQTL